MLSTPHQAIAQPEIDQPTLRLTPGILLQIADFQFVDTKTPDFDRDVLQPLKAAQAVKAAADAKAEADRIAKRQADCASVSGHLEGELCIVPPPVINIAPRASYAAPTAARYNGAVSYGNNYTAGQCTWYVANRVSVPSSMGNASAWGYGLSAAGWGRTLAPGSIGVAGNHVVYVESVGGDGVHISDMNFAGPFLITFRTVSAGSYSWFHN